MTSTQGPGTSVTWQRLHPLTPVVSAGRVVAVLVVVAAEASAGRTNEGPTLVVDLALLALTVIASVVRWLVTRWALDGVTLRIETGLLRRDARQLPLARIQAVDVVRPFLARIVGLAELKIRLAGSSRSSGRLAYLPELAALDLRARLLAGHHGLDLSTPEPAEVPLASVPTGPLVAAALLAPAALLTVGLAVAIVFLMALSPTAAAALGGFLAVYVLAFGRLTWRRVVEQYGFSVAQAPDGIRVRRGLFSTVAETVPFQRVQAVRKVQPLLWRPWGWCRLEVDVAGSPGREQGTRSGRVTRALLPVGPTALADGLLWSLLSIRGPVVTGPPRRARLKAPLSYHFLAAGHDGALAAAVTGRVRKVTTWVPLEKIQSIRRVQGPVQRALGLVSVHADAAGRHVRAEFRDRDATEADGLFEDLVLAARSQRRLVSGRPPLSAVSSGPASPGPGPPGPAVTATRQAGQPPPPPA